MSASRPDVRRRPRPILEHPTYVSPQYHSRIWSRLIFVLLILGLGVGLGVGGGLYWALHRPQSSSGRGITLRVRSGDTISSIAGRLEHEGIISSALLFRLDARIQRLGTSLKAGDYHLRRNMSLDQMVAALAVYHAENIAVTIPEGWRAEQIAAKLARYGVSARQFMQAVDHPDRRVLALPVLRGKPAGASLEGYLFPNTYKIPKHFSGRQMVDYMVSTLNARITAAMLAQAARERWTVFQALTLASIVEREAKVPQERAHIAGVYANRLHAGMGLYADPTVQYAMGTSRNWWPVLNAPPGQLKPTSPYNTYVHPGLPPGPICNPGLASIRAALSPARTRDLYFVAKGNGTHAFAETLAQQEANIAKYQR
jgi:UPF0755 protein